MFFLIIFYLLPPSLPPSCFAAFLPPCETWPVQLFTRVRHRLFVTIHINMRCQSSAVICAALLLTAAATQVVAQSARYLEQRQDHFDGGNANTWLQAYTSYP
jgi:hypothetical protein